MHYKKLTCVLIAGTMALSHSVSAFADLDRYIDKTNTLCQLTAQQTVPEDIEVIDYDQRNPRVAAFMDEVEYEGYPNIHSRTPEYAYMKCSDHSPACGYMIDVMQNQTLNISDCTDLSAVINPVVMEDDGAYEIANLIPYHIYHIILNNDDGAVALEQYIRPIGATNIIETPTMPNVRDIGGLPVDGGMIKHGLIYRGIPCSTAISDPEKTALDMKIMEQLGIKLEVDLRGGDELDWTVSVHEKAGTPDKSEIPGADYVISPITSYKRAVDINDKKNKNAADALRLVMDSAVRGEPVIFHCSGGADRTGTIAFLLEGLLGASESELDKEYELTTFAGGSRLRSVDGYIIMKKVILGYDGETLQEKFYNWFLASGFQKEELNTFIETMVVQKP